MTMQLDMIIEMKSKGDNINNYDASNFKVPKSSLNFCGAM